MTSLLLLGRQPTENPTPLLPVEEVSSERSISDLVVNTPENPLPSWVHLQFTPEDKLLAKLYHSGIIDADWVVQKEEADKGLNLLCVDKVKYSQLLDERIAVMSREHSFKVPFSRLLHICHFAGLKSETGISDFIIHGSFVPYLLDKESLREYFQKLAPDVSSLVGGLCLEFRYSDVDFRMKALRSEKVDDFSFNQQFNEVVVRELISKRCLYEIHQLQFTVKSIKTVQLEELLNIYKKQWANNTIALVLYNPINENRVLFSREQFREFFDTCTATKWNRRLCVDYLYQTFFLDLGNVTRMGKVSNHHLNADSIKLDNTKLPADIVYARFDGGATARMSHQEICVNLLDSLANKSQPTVRTNSQAVVDLCCRTAHWTKEEVNKFDFFAYIFTITCGRRFPNREAEEKLKKQYSVERAWYQVDPIADMISFNKLKHQSDDLKVVYLLNGLQILNDPSLDLKPEFLKLSPQDPVLKEIVRVIVEGKLEITTIYALLQIAAHFSLHVADQRLKVDIVAHLGVPHYKISFDNSSLMLPIHLGNTWDVLTHCGLEIWSQQDILQVCLGMEYSSVPEQNPLFESASQLVDVLTISRERLPAHYESTSEMVKKLARFLLLNQLQMYPEETLCAACLDQEFLRKVQGCQTEQGLNNVFLGMVSCITQSEKKRFTDLIHTFFSQDAQSLSKIVNKLLLLSCESFFVLGLKWAQHLSMDCVQTIEYYLENRKILKALRIMELAAETVETKWLQTISSILIHAWHVKGFNPQVQDPIVRYGKLLKAALGKDSGDVDWLADKEDLRAMFEGYKLQDVAEEVQKAINDETEQQNHLAFRGMLSAFCHAPTLSGLQVLLKTYPEYKEEIQYQLNELLPLTVKKHPRQFLDIVKEDQIRKDLKESLRPEKLHELMQQVVGALVSSSAFLLEVFEFQELITPELCLILIENTVKTSREDLKTKVLELVRRKLDGQKLPLDLKRKVSFGLVKLESSKKAMDCERYVHDICRLLNTYSDEINPPLKMFFDLYNFVINILEKGVTDLHVMIAVELRNFIAERCVKNENAKLLLKYDLRFIVNGLNHFDGTDNLPLELATEYISQNSWSKNELNQFQKAFFTLIERNYFDMELKSMQDIVSSILEQFDKQEFYADFIDGLLQITKDKALGVTVQTALVNFDTLYTADSKGKIPQYYLNYLAKRIDKIDDLDNLVSAGVLMAQQVIPPKSRNDFQQIQRKYFAKFFSLIFSESGQFAQASAIFWNDVRKIFSDLFGTYAKIQYVNEMKILKHPINLVINHGEHENLNALFFLEEIFQLVITTAATCVDEETITVINPNRVWEQLKESLLQKCPFMAFFVLLPSTNLDESYQPLQILLEELYKIHPQRADLILLHRTIGSYIFTFTKDPRYAPYFEVHAMMTFPQLDAFERRIYENGTNLTYNFLSVDERIGLSTALQLKSQLHVEYRLLFTNRVIHKEWVPAQLVDKALENIFQKIIKGQLHLSNALIGQLIFHYLSHWSERYPLKCMKAVTQLVFSDRENGPIELLSSEAFLLSMVEVHLKYTRSCKGKYVNELLDLHRSMSLFFKYYATRMNVEYIGAADVFLQRMEYLELVKKSPVFEHLIEEIGKEEAECIVIASEYVNEKHSDFIFKIHFHGDHSYKADLLHRYLEFVHRLTKTEDLKFLKDSIQFPRVWSDIFISQTSMIVLIPDTPAQKQLRQHSIVSSILILLEWWDSCPDGIVIQEYIALVQRLTPYIPAFASMEVEDKERRLTRLLKIYVHAFHLLLVSESIQEKETCIIRNIFRNFLEQLKSSNRILYQQILNNIIIDARLKVVFKFALVESK